MITVNPGQIITVKPSNPAAGTDFLVTVPPGARWQLLAARATLTTSAAVGNRQVGFTFDDGGALSPFIVINQTTQAASLGGSYDVCPGGGQNLNVGQENLLPFPARVILAAGYRFHSFTFGLQAGDQWGSICLLVEQWLDG